MASWVSNKVDLGWVPRTVSSVSTFSNISMGSASLSFSGKGLNVIFQLVGVVDGFGDCGGYDWAKALGGVNLFAIVELAFFNFLVFFI